MLNVSKGNMYSFITHTYNTIKGKCEHDCSYCYMKRFKQKDIRFDNNELKTDLRENNFVFVGSSNDMFSKNIKNEWILKTLDYCDSFNNKYLFQSKNPFNFLNYINHPIIKKSVFCTTIESNKYYEQFMKKSPLPKHRSFYTNKISEKMNTFVTIEPLIDFDLIEMIELIKLCNPTQVNIGADSGNNNLIEPSKEKVLQLIDELQKFTTIHNKTNINRLIK